MNVHTRIKGFVWFIRSVLLIILPSISNCYSSLLNSTRNWRNVWWNVNCTVRLIIRTGLILDVTQFRPFLAYLSNSRPSFEIRVNFQIALLIPIGGIKLIFAGCVVRALRHPEKTAVELLLRSVLRKDSLKRIRPTFNLARIRQIIYSIYLSRSIAIPMSRLTLSYLYLSWNYGVGNVLFRLGISRSAMLLRRDPEMSKRDF